jgi:hypothetical protein
MCAATKNGGTKAGRRRHAGGRWEGEAAYDTYTDTYTRKYISRNKNIISVNLGTHAANT